MATKYKEEDDATEHKKTRMKTASEVISRLLWDESLPKEHFIVGYLDRFVGVVEKPFTQLDWNDPAVVDNYSLALPKHRIQYFKYKNRKVWEKSTRKDYVFGSTGCPMNIHDFMKKTDEDLCSMENELQENFVDSDDESCNSDDSTKEEVDRVLPDNLNRPNFFIAARITDTETVNNLNEVSLNIKSKDPLLGECCLAKEVYHITFTILKLNSPAEVAETVKILHDLKSLHLPPVKITLSGLSLFKNRVLFSCVDRQQELLHLRNCLVEKLTEKKIDITDRFSFVPHVTVIKISRTVAHLRHSKYIDQYLYSNFEDNYFGTQLIDSLYLCEMGQMRRDDGFYLCAGEAKIT